MGCFRAHAVAALRARGDELSAVSRSSQEYAEAAPLIAKALPAQLAFVAIVGNKMLDRYANLKEALLEFGAEWILYMFGGMEHFLGARTAGVCPPRPPCRKRSQRLFFFQNFYGCRNPMTRCSLKRSLFLTFLFRLPQGTRGNATAAVRGDLSAVQKRKILYDDPISSLVRCKLAMKWSDEVQDVNG